MFSTTGLLNRLSRFSSCLRLCYVTVGTIHTKIPCWIVWVLNCDTFIVWNSIVYMCSHIHPLLRPVITEIVWFAIMDAIRASHDYHYFSFILDYYLRVMISESVHATSVHWTCSRSSYLLGLCPSVCGLFSWWSTLTLNALFLISAQTVLEYLDHPYPSSYGLSSTKSQSIIWVGKHITFCLSIRKPVILDLLNNNYSCDNGAYFSLTQQIFVFL